MLRGLVYVTHESEVSDRAARATLIESLVSISVQNEPLNQFARFPSRFQQRWNVSSFRSRGTPPSCFSVSHFPRACHSTDCFLQAVVMSRRLGKDVGCNGNGQKFDEIRTSHLTVKLLPFSANLSISFSALEFYKYGCWKFPMRPQFMIIPIVCLFYLFLYSHSWVSISPNMSSPESQSVDDPKVEVFKPGWRLLAAICSLGIVNLACALDATSIAIALPVGSISPSIPL